MSTAIVPLTALSFSKDIDPIPVVERTLITFDEAVEFQVVSYEESEWHGHDVHSRQIWTLEWCWGAERGGIPLESPLNSMQCESRASESVSGLV